jgi:hypothetical protein
MKEGEKSGSVAAVVDCRLAGAPRLTSFVGMEP